MESHYGHTENGRERITARAIGRAQASELELRDVAQRMGDFTKNREFLPVVFQGPNGQDRTASLHDLQPRALAEKLSSLLDRLELSSINEALQNYHQEILAKFESLKQFTVSAREIAESTIDRLAFLEKGNEVRTKETTGHAEFTERELIRMETFAAKQFDQPLRDQVESVIKSSLLTTAAHHTEVLMTARQPGQSFSSESQYSQSDGRIDTTTDAVASCRTLTISRNQTGFRH